MKTVGLIGGMSYESTLDYYRIINKEINEKLGGLHSAKILLESYDFSEIEHLQSNEEWDELAKILIQSAQKLESMGANYIAIATNTMHIVANEVQNNINIPLIHIAQATGNYAKEKRLKNLALLGTKYTMTKSFYKDKLKDEFNINVILPNEEQQKTINNIIFNELCKGVYRTESQTLIEAIILDCKFKGAQGVILGCTELPILVKRAPIELINTTKIHCLEISKALLS